MDGMGLTGTSGNFFVNPATGKKVPQTAISSNTNMISASNADYIPGKSLLKALFS